MSHDKQECSDANDDDIRSIEGSELTMETASIGTGTIGDGNAHGNESTLMNTLQQANKVQLEKLKEVERPIIQTNQEKIDESDQEMATRNAAYRKQKQELVQKDQMEICQLEAKKWEKNIISKETTSFKEELEEKINLIMGKKVVVNPAANTIGNCWKKATNSISTDGLNATNNSNKAHIYQSVSAQKGFIISVDFCGPVLFYFEVTNMSSYKWPIFVGLSSENIPDGTCVGEMANSYAIQDGCDHCWLSEKKHYFEWPNGVIKPEWTGEGDVLGCGLLLNPENKLSIFFTGNGILMGRKIPIEPTADLLYPTITMYGNVSVEANFGEDLAKLFTYNIQKCPGLIFT